MIFSGKTAGNSACSGFQGKTQGSVPVLAFLETTPLQLYMDPRVQHPSKNKALRNTCLRKNTKQKLPGGPLSVKHL